MHSNIGTEISNFFFILDDSFLLSYLIVTIMCVEHTPQFIFAAIVLNFSKFGAFPSAFGRLKDS